MVSERALKFYADPSNCGAQKYISEMAVELLERRKIAPEVLGKLRDALEVMEIAIHDAHPTEFSMMRQVIVTAKIVIAKAEREP